MYVCMYVYDRHSPDAYVLTGEIMKICAYDCMHTHVIHTQNIHTDLRIGIREYVLTL